eukprot:Gb_33404 [translate_table: standard]
MEFLLFGDSTLPPDLRCIEMIKGLWRLLLLTTLWNIWLNRNNKCFNDILLDPCRFWLKIIRSVEEQFKVANPKKIVTNFPNTDTVNKIVSTFNLVKLTKELRLTPHSTCYDLGTKSNNVAEFKGLMRGLRIALKLALHHINILHDSMLVTNLINSKWTPKHEQIRDLQEETLDPKKPEPDPGLPHGRCWSLSRYFALRSSTVCFSDSINLRERLQEKVRSRSKKPLPVFRILSKSLRDCLQAKERSFSLHQTFWFQVLWLSFIVGCSCSSSLSINLSQFGPDVFPLFYFRINGSLSLSGYSDLRRFGLARSSDHWSLLLTSQNIGGFSCPVNIGGFSCPVMRIFKRSTCSKSLLARCLWQLIATYNVCPPWAVPPPSPPFGALRPCPPLSALCFAPRVRSLPGHPTPSPSAPYFLSTLLPFALCSLSAWGERRSPRAPTSSLLTPPSLDALPRPCALPLLCPTLHAPPSAPRPCSPPRQPAPPPSAPYFPSVPLSSVLHSPPVPPFPVLPPKLDNNFRAKIIVQFRFFGGGGGGFALNRAMYNSN